MTVNLTADRSLSTAIVPAQADIRRLPPAVAWLRRAATRLRLHLVLWHVRADLARMPGFVLRDIDVDRAIYSAARVLSRRRLERRKAGGWPWTS